MAIIFLVNGINVPVQMFFPLFAIIYPALIVIQFWKYVTSKDNKLLLLERFYEIDNEKINGIIDRETYSPIKLDHFIKADLVRNTYLLFVSKNQFIFIPVDAFESHQDREWFEKEILPGLKKKAERHNTLVCLLL